MALRLEEWAPNLGPWALRAHTGANGFNLTIFPNPRSRVSGLYPYAILHHIGVILRNRLGVQRSG